MIPLYI